MENWLELDARIALARYRVHGDGKYLALARELAFEAGLSACYDSLPIKIVSPSALILDEQSLLRRWHAGRRHSIALVLESEEWTLPCECDEMTGYVCGHHFETTSNKEFLRQAAKIAAN